MTGGAFAVLGALCALTPAQFVELDDAVLSLSDISALECIAPERRAEIGALPLLSIRHDRALTREALASLVRRRVPALADIVLSGDSSEIIRLTQVASRSSSPANICYTARSPISSGEIVSEASVQEADCRQNAGAPPLRYDRRDGTVRASAAIASGDYLGPMLALPAPVADAGDKLVLSISAGVVVIERNVEALQASTGDAIFVRDENGGAFSVPVATVRAR